MQARPRQLWRRRVTRAVLCLLLGAVTTVGVAWGAAAVATPTTRKWARTWRVVAVGGGQQWDVSYKRSACCTDVYVVFAALPPSTGVLSLQYSHPPPEPILAAAEATSKILPVERFNETPLGRQIGAAWALSPTAAPISDPVASEALPRETIETMAMGWPSRCLMYVHFWKGTRSAEGAEQFSVVESGTRGGVWWRRTLFPYSAIPLGFLLDTVFYAAPWWIILVAPGAVRRWRRRRRGRCIHCGYDLAGLRAEPGSPKCPECGA